MGSWVRWLATWRVGRGDLRAYWVMPPWERRIARAFAVPPRMLRG